MCAAMFTNWRSCFAPDNIDGILALIGGFSVHLTLGTLYCFGNLNTYITSYLRKHVHPGIAYSDMIWVPTLATVSQGLFMTCSGYLEERVGVRSTIILGCSIMVSGVLLTSVAIRLSVLLTIFTYGCLFGLGLALAYAPPLAVAMKWFPRSKGLVNGVIVGGFGLGAFIFNQIQTAYLNPLNHKLGDHGEYFIDDKILNRVPSCFLLLGSLYAVIQAMAILLIRPPPESDLSSMMPLVSSRTDLEDVEDDSFCRNGSGEMRNLIDADDDEDEDLDLDSVDFSSSNITSTATSVLTSTGGVNSASEITVRLGQPLEENVKPGQMVRTREFWVLWGTFFLNTQAIGYINAMYKAYGQEYINDDHFLAIVGALAAVFNASGRVFWGNMCDAFSYKSCMVVVSVIIAVLYLTFNFIQFGGKPLFAMWVWAIFFCICANFVLLPTATAQCFGTRYLSKNYGLVMTGQSFAAPLTALLTQFLNPLLGWLGMFSIVATFSILNAIVNIKFFPTCPSPRHIHAKLERPSQL